MNELNIEAFGGIIDQLLTENEVNALIEKKFGEKLDSLSEHYDFCKDKTSSNESPLA